MSRRFAADAVWTRQGLRTRTAVVTDEQGVILHLDRIRDDDEVHQGLLVPGLVNAHTHLGLSWMELVPGGEGFVPWAGRLMAQRRQAPALEHQLRALRTAAETCRALGTALVCDITDDPKITARAVAAVGLTAVVQEEWLGFDRRLMSERLQGIREALPERPGVLCRPAAHAPYSTAPQLLTAVAQVGAAAPASVHLAEDVEEVAFLKEGTGAFAELLDHLGRDWRWWTPPGTTSVGYLDQLGILGPHVLAVHGVHTTAADHQKLAEAGAPVCLCPRSNLHIGGALPDVVSMLEAGVPLALGTDSLASSPDLDLFAEIVVLAQAFPSVDIGTWLHLATDSGAKILGRPDLGAIDEGCAPGLLLIDSDLESLGQRVPQRRWLLEPSPQPWPAQRSEA